MMGKQGIVLIGMAGVGKSTIGSALARALGFNFTDLDEYIQEKDGQTVQEVIDTRGEEALLQLEKQRMLELDMQRKVIAPGGSIIYNSGLMEYLKRHSVLIYLEDTFENIQTRLKNAPTRGIVGLRNKSLRQIYDERHPLYAIYADICVETAGKSLEKIVSEIQNQYRRLQ